ncbi:serine hydrolase [Emticicia sp. BO119]|uniref:serine hydrolase domain-containing protein n=1 Tax=Emticicia sp. BO119 TaxID=2757768 RepID=UPI0015F0D89C|nr:serine hydrolase domain-containing protein [Emticicia sp. BO119]MBA4849585.1 beta-lactamase family protein [Emticicia sp. BO119]
MKKLFIVFFLMLSLCRAGYGQPIDKAKLDQFFDRLNDKNKAMGSLVIAKNGEIQYERFIGYGMINVNDKKLLTEKSRFRIGSITKMFTAAIIMQLVEEGKLKLNENLDRFLPQMPNAHKITILHILRHRSGIPNVKRVQNEQENVNTLPITKEEMLALIVGATPDFEPDTRHSYSNSAYLVLGFVIEKITGKSYEEVLNERIISKIGLKDTYLATGNIDVTKNEVLSYMNLGNAWKQLPETHPSMLFSAGAIVSTPAEMAKFIQALFDGKIVSKSSLEQMMVIKEGDGLGMEPFTFAGRTFYGHTGGVDNYGSWLAYLPEEQLVFSYTTNAKVYPVGKILDGIADIYFNKPFTIPTFESFAVSTEILDKYVGVYASIEAPVKFTITRKGEEIFFKPPGESAPVALEAISENRFQIEGAIVVEFDSTKKQMTIKRRNGERTFIKED